MTEFWHSTSGLGLFGGTACVVHVTECEATVQGS